MPVLIDIDYTVTDLDNDQVVQTVEYSADGISYSPVSMNTSDPLHVFSATIPAGTTVGGVNQHIVHDAEADLGQAYIGSVFYRITLDDGTDQSQFDTSISVNLNDEPVVTTVTGTVRANGSVDISYRVSDAESHDVDLTQCEWDTDPSFSSASPLTAIASDPAHDGTTGLNTTPSGVDHNFVWDASADLTTPFSGTIYVRKNVTDSLGAVGSGAIGSFNYKTRGVAASIGTAFGRPPQASQSSRGLAARSRSVRSRNRRLRFRF